MSVTVYASCEGGPEMNMSNLNAAAVLGLAGIEDSSGGRLKVSELDIVQRNVFQALNHSLKPFARPTENVTANFIVCGIDEQYLNDRLSELLEIITFAQREKCDVFWG